MTRTPRPRRSSVLSYLSATTDDGRPVDYVAPLALVGVVLCLLGMFWTPVTSAGLYRLAQQAPDGRPAAWAWAWVFPLILFGIFLLGFVGGLGCLPRLRWARVMFVAFAGLLLTYVVAAVTWTLFDRGLAFAEASPRWSATVLFVGCSVGFFGVLVAYLAAVLRHFTRSDVARTFR